MLAILAIGFQSFLLFLALFEPSLRYKVSKPPSAPLDTEEFDRILATLADSALHKCTLNRGTDKRREFYEAELEAIAKAQRSVNLEAYIFQKGEVTRRFVEALTERARAGVKVNMVLDAIGSFATWNSYFKELKDAGGRVEWYHGFKWHQLPRLNSRTHREILVIDCEVAFVGGAGFADHWLIPKKEAPALARHDVPHRRGCRLIHPGDICRELAGGVRRTADRRRVLLLRPKPSRQRYPGNRQQPDVRPVDACSHAVPDTACSAKETIEITTPYFLPDRPARRNDSRR